MRHQTAERGLAPWILVLVVALLIVTLNRPAEAVRSNITRARSYQVLAKTALSTETVTSSSIPVGDVEDLSYEIAITALGASESVTVDVLGISSTWTDPDRTAAFNTLGYHTTFGAGGQRVFTTTTENIYIVPFPGGIESVQFRTQASSTATVAIVATTL